MTTKLFVVAYIILFAVLGFMQMALPCDLGQDTIARRSTLCEEMQPDNYIRCMFEAGPPRTGERLSASTNNR